jgi:hypothetical protein
LEGSGVVHVSSALLVILKKMKTWFWLSAGILSARFSTLRRRFVRGRVKLGQTFYFLRKNEEYLFLMEMFINLE